jgi:hypothetical protein
VKPTRVRKFHAGSTTVFHKRLKVRESREAWISVRATPEAAEIIPLSSSLHQFLSISLLFLRLPHLNPDTRCARKTSALWCRPFTQRRRLVQAINSRVSFAPVRTTSKTVQAVYSRVEHDVSLKRPAEGRTSVLGRTSSFALYFCSSQE